MTAVLHGAVGAPVGIMYTSPWFERVTQNGGLGKLPGDAVTADLNNEAARIEAASSMPFQRALDNLIRDGQDRDFAVRYLRAITTGGQTSATSLDLAVTKTFKRRTNEVVIERAALPADRYFRDAWRRTGDGIVIDLTEAKALFARKLVLARSQRAKELTEKIEEAMLLERPSDRLDAQYQIVQRMNLRALGAKIVAATTPTELRALWPEDLPAAQ